MPEKPVFLSVFEELSLKMGPECDSFSKIVDTCNAHCAAYGKEWTSLMTDLKILGEWEGYAE